MALRVILETYSPGGAKQLYWHLDPTRVSAMDENITLLEFCETELVFAEFVRLLVRLADIGTRRDLNLCDKLGASQRLEGFFKYIFMPALRTPYVPPVPTADEVSEKASDAGGSQTSEMLPPPSEKDP